MAIIATRYQTDADRLATAQCSIMVRDNPGGPEAYKDGDIVSMWSRLDIARTWAEWLCHVSNSATNTDGLRTVNSLAYRWRMLARKYRCRRTGENTYEKQNIATSEVEAMTMDGLHDFLATRRKHKLHEIFGRNGSEIWFAEKLEMTGPRVRAAWNAIQNNSAHREIDHRLCPTGTSGIRFFGWIALDDMTIAEARQLIEPDVDVVDDGQGGTNQVIVRKRKFKVPWRDLPSADNAVDVSHWTDLAYESDVRDVTRFDRTGLLEPR